MSEVDLQGVILAAVVGGVIVLLIALHLKAFSKSSGVGHLQAQLEYAKRQVGTLEAERQKTRELLIAVEPVWSRALGLQNALDEMKRVWLDPKSREAECETVLCNHLWVLQPDYEVVKVRDEKGQLRPKLCVRKSLSHIFKEHFDGHKRVVTRFDDKKSKRRIPDFCGWFVVRGSIQPSHSRAIAGQSHGAENEKYVIIELKRPRVRIRRIHIRQVYYYATILMQMAESRLWGRPIECFVIGGSIDSKVNDVHLRWGNSPHSAIRITPLTYEQLYERARLIANPLLATPEPQ